MRPARGGASFGGAEDAAYRPRRSRGVSTGWSQRFNGSKARPKVAAGSFMYLYGLGDQASRREMRHSVQDGQKRVAGRGWDQVRKKQVDGGASEGLDRSPRTEERMGGLRCTLRQVHGTGVEQTENLGGAPPFAGCGHPVPIRYPSR